MDRDPTAWDYLFVSDLHLSLGYDPDRRAYHAREDFFFDAAFFRWLRWADRVCTPGRRWELVLLGDTFDFLPVDEAVREAYFQEQDRRRREGDLEDARWAMQYWDRRFAQPLPADPIARRVRRLLFEQDVREGRIHLRPLSRQEVTAWGAGLSRVPEWAVDLYVRYHPEAAADAEAGRAFVLRRPSPKAYAAFRPEAVEEREAPAGRARKPRHEEAFERRYGFLPTPERSADKLESIYRGHPLFFRALAWFVGQGHRVVFLRGNHDLDLFWPEAQERLRAFIIREAPAALGGGEGHPSLKSLAGRILFRPGWLYYRRGLFYAEHGSQYEMLNACANPIRPVLFRDGHRLNLPVGSLGVICFHNHLEDRFPEWENQGAHGVVLLDLLRRHPLEMFGLLLRHSGDFFRMARMLWEASRREDQAPSEADLTEYAAAVGLEVEAVRRICGEGETPLLARRPLAWFLFSPAGHILKGVLLVTLIGLGLVGAGLWYLLVVPLMAGLIPSGFPFATVGPALQLLSKVLLWLIPPALYQALRRWLARRYPQPFLFEAARRLHGHLRGEDHDLRFYLFGHTHQPDVRLVERRDDGRHVYYLNTGSWTPYFAAGERRLRRLGEAVQFTFARLRWTGRGYEADLLRWNDDAGRAEEQIVPLTRGGSLTRDARSTEGRS